MAKKWLTKHKDISVSGLDPKITNYLGSLPPDLQQEILITATSGGKHTKGSLHYNNRAVDLRFSEKLWDYIKSDPARHEAGLTLIDPDHGTAKHIHLSNALGTKKEFYGEIDPEGRRNIYQQKGWDLSVLDKKAVVPSVPSPQQVTQQQFINNPVIEQVKPLAESTTQPIQQNYQVPNMQYENWNPYGYETGQILLNPLEQTKSKPKISSKEKAQLDVLLEQVNPVMKSAMKSIIAGFDEEDETPQKRRVDESPMYSSTAPSSGTTPVQQSSGRSGQYNAGNLRNADGSFKSFATPEEGRQALVNQLTRYQTGNNRVGVKPENTLYEAMSTYAPASDNNRPKQYAEFIAKNLGISPNTQIKDIDPNAWADQVAKMEGNKSYLSAKKENGGWLSQYQNGGDLSPEKARKMLHEGKIGKKKITEKQRKYFGYVASKKENGGWLNNYI